MERAFKAPLVADNNGDEWFLMIQDSRSMSARLIDVAAMCSMNGFGEQHAKAIALAVNSHDQLREALQEAKALLEFNGIDIDDSADYGNGVAGDIMARIAVALAESDRA